MHFLCNADQVPHGHESALVSLDASREPPEVIALYKRRRTNEEGRVLFFLSRGDGHTYLSPEERKAYNAQLL
jgi:hypothetical protein